MFFYCCCLKLFGVQWGGWSKAVFYFLRWVLSCPLISLSDSIDFKGSTCTLQMPFWVFKNCNFHGCETLATDRLNWWPLAADTVLGGVGNIRSGRKQSAHVRAERTVSGSPVLGSCWSLGDTINASWPGLGNSNKPYALWPIVKRIPSGSNNENKEVELAQWFPQWHFGHGALCLNEVNCTAGQPGRDRREATVLQVVAWALKSGTFLSPSSLDPCFPHGV